MKILLVFIVLSITTLYFGSCTTLGFANDIEKVTPCLEEKTEQSPLDGCRRVNRLLHLQHEDISAYLSNILGQGNDPLTDISYENILEESFSNCLRTPDNRFYIPNNYKAEMLMDRRIDKSASLVTNFKEVSKTTSSNGAGDGNYEELYGTGSFNYKQTKKSLEKNRESMLQTTISNKMYVLSGDLSSNFSVTFWNRLNPLITAINLRRYMQARYLTQKIIRDFGTHITMEAVVGTSFETRKYSKGSSPIEHRVKQIQEEALQKTLLNNSLDVKNSDSMGASTRNVETWAMGIKGLNSIPSGLNVDPFDDSHPVPLSRKIYPLYLMMDNEIFGLENSIQRKLRDYFEEATNEYFERNKIRGCTATDEANYDYQANVDDFTCEQNNKDQNLNLLPSGIFQVCNTYPDSIDYDRELRKMGKQKPQACLKFNVKNFVTNDLKCSKKQNANLVIKYDYILPDYIVKNETMVCFEDIELDCINISVIIVIREKITLTSYWCSSPTASMSFGGYFDFGQVNNFNRKKSCGTSFNSVKLFHGTTFCLKSPSRSEAQLTLLYNEKNSNVSCSENHSKQLITVIDRQKIYACILKRSAYKNLNSPTTIKGPYLEEREAKDDYDKSFLTIYHNNTLNHTIFLKTIQNNIVDYVESHITKLVSEPSVS